METLTRVYVNSSVWNSVFNEHTPDLQRQAREFLDFAERAAGIGLYISDLVLDELSRAPDARAEKVMALIRRLNPDRLVLDEPAADLANAYVEFGVLTAAHADDARHVAIATVARLDVLVSWNYRHLVNRRRREAFNGVNAVKGYRLIDILSPPEVFNE